MGRPNKLLAATLLGPNTVDGLRRLVGHLNRGDREVEIVGLDAGEIASGKTTAREIGVDLLWACGLLTAELVSAGVDLEVFAAPVFDGETEAVYRSVIVAGEVPAVSRRLAVNEFGSWSGYRVLFHDAAAHPGDRWHPDTMDEVVLTGAHVESVAAVAAGRADLAAIDHSIWDWLVANDQALVEGVRVVGQTVDCPAPPLSVLCSDSFPDRLQVIDELLAFAGPPMWVPATIDDYQFMVATS